MGQVMTLMYSLARFGQGATRHGPYPVHVHHYGRWQSDERVNANVKNGFRCV